MSASDMDRKVAMNSELYNYKRKVIAAILGQDDIIDALNTETD